MLGSLLLAILSGCQMAPADLQQTLCKARLAWYPYHSEVSVRRCLPQECQWVKVRGGGVYLVKERAIVISDVDPSYYGNGFVPPKEVEEYFLILHEYGHALGLRDNTIPTSIMKQGWLEPWANEPGPMEFNELSLYGVREFKP